VEQLRLLIGQQIGLRFILANAIAILQVNVLAEGDHYPGDLLNSILSLSKQDWDQNLNNKKNLTELLRSNISTIEATENRELIKKARSYLV
jgi:hypothetical protein